MAKQSERLQAIESSLRGIEDQIKNPIQLLEAIKKIENAVKDIRREIKETQEELAKIQEYKKEQEKEHRIVKADNLKMKKDINELRDIIETQETEKRQTWIEFTGIESEGGFEHREMVNKIHEVCKLKIKPEEIKESYRKNNTRNQKISIVVKYSTREVKERVQRAVKGKRLKTSDIGGAEGGQAVFANDCLSYFTSNLFWQVRQARYEKRWKAAWTYRGKIFLCIENDGEVLSIKNQDDLIALL